jgi:hypothetical protein
MKMNLKETGRVIVDCIRLVRGRNQWRAFENTAMNRQIP